MVQAIRLQYIVLPFIYTITYLHIYVLAFISCVVSVISLVCIFSLLAKALYMYVHQLSSNLIVFLILSLGGIAQLLSLLDILQFIMSQLTA